MLHFVNGSPQEEIFAMLNQICARQTDGVIWAIHEIEGNRDWVCNIQVENYPRSSFELTH